MKTRRRRKAVDPRRSVPRWMAQVEEFPGKMHGAKMSDVFDGHTAALEAFGERADGRDSGLTAFTYLWRRFGPPVHGSDGHKDLCGYHLGTPMRGVFLLLTPSGSPLAYAAGYLVTEAILGRCRRPAVAWERAFRKWYVAQSCGATEKNYWDVRMDQKTVRRAVKVLGRPPREPLLHEPGAWRKASPLVRRINEALLAALRELLRPVYCRDVPFNAFGVLTDEEAGEWVEAEPSPLAGYGVPVDRMRELIAQHKREKVDATD
jgi:hypothetical protein